MFLQPSQLAHQVAHGLIAVLRVFLQHAVENMNQLRGRIRQVLLQRFRFLVQNGIHDRRFIVAAERHFAGEHFKQNHTK